jgi:hypothetical protein
MVACYQIQMQDYLNDFFVNCIIFLKGGEGYN